MTDDSLRTERESIDLLVAERSDVIESADQIVELARERADVVLDAAREQADLESQAVGMSGRAQAEVDAGRARDDESLRLERAAADELLRSEREEQLVLAALLPLSREKTDRNLLTERARSDEELAHRDDFLGMVSHDLRNLLCGLLMESSKLAYAASDSDEGRRVVAAMQRFERYAARMNGLIGDLVDVVSIDAGKLSVRPVRRDAAPLLAEAAETFKPAAAEKGVVLHNETDGGALPADFDAGRILQVLTNLITNGIKFTPRGGRIVLRGERVGAALRVSVTDTGTGIPAAHTETVFQRFWQAGADDRRGLGLGLYISKCIVDAHHGRIWVESTPGAGSAFFFTLPDARPQLAA